MAVGPLVFVPGLSGSTLSAPAASFLQPSYTVWMSPPALLAGGVERMRLPVGGEDDPPTSAPLVAGGALPSFYGPALAVLSSLGWRVYLPACDWRRPYNYDAPAVRDAVLAAARGGDGVKILCHSRGGLVTRWALRLLALSGQLGLVERVVCLGTPHAGSLQAVAALGCYSGAKQSISKLGYLFPAFLSRNVAPETVARAVRSWPGVYQLLPRPGNSYMPATDTALCYSPGVYALSPARPVAAYLTSAAQDWSELPAVPDTVDWIDVVGTGVPTDVGIAGPGAFSGPGHFVVSNSGDGIVPAASASAPGRRRVLTPTGHNALVIDARLAPVIHQALRAGLSADLVLQGDVLVV